MKRYLVVLSLFAVICVRSQELVWHEDVSKAAKISFETKKPLLLFFTGSDWCGWCRKLQNEVLKTPEFAKWAKSKVVLVELDYPRTKQQSAALKQQNQQLAGMFAVPGYPTVQFVTVVVEGNKMGFQSLGSMGYVAGGPNAWITEAEKYF